MFAYSIPPNIKMIQNMNNFKLYEITQEGISDLQERYEAIKQGVDDLESLFIQRKEYKVEDGIAYINVTGPLLRKASEFEKKTGITTYEQITDELELAQADDTVDMVVLMVDSPGGDAQGSIEVTGKVANFPKPVYAYVEGLAASAAMKIASASTSIISTKSGIIGSIGSVIVVESKKAMVNSMGITRTIFTNSEASNYKGMGQDFGDLTEAQKDYIQSMVEESGVEFKNTIIRNRPEVSNEVFTAKTYNAKKALEFGLIDEIVN